MKLETVERVERRGRYTGISFVEGKGGLSIGEEKFEIAVVPLSKEKLIPNIVLIFVSLG